MNSIYIDTSSLVKFYYPETDSDKVESVILDSERVYISNLSLVEMASALSKKVRTGELKKKMEKIIWNSFLDDLHTDKMEIISINERHYLKASELIRECGDKSGLKTLDSIHLAVALGLKNISFLSADDVLSKLARKIQIKLVSI